MVRGLGQVRDALFPRFYVVKDVSFVRLKLKAPGLFFKLVHTSVF